MTIEIHEPEVVALIERRMESGVFPNVDELLKRALYALRDNPETPSVPKTQRRLVDVLNSPPFLGSELEMKRQVDYFRPIDL